VNRLFKAGKAATALFWAAVVFNQFSPLQGSIGEILETLGALVVGIHFCEMVAFGVKYKNLLPNLLMHCTLVLVFGFFHFLEAGNEATRPN